LKKPKYPQQLELIAINRTLSVTYTKTALKGIKLLPTPSQLAIMGNIDDWEKVRKKLIQYLKQTAFLHFEPWLFRLSAEIKLPIKSLRIRHMRSRWGSCDRDGNICLNSELLFLPPELVQHVMLHELCHRKYMSHGPRFWGLLNRFDENCEGHKKALRKFAQHYSIT
jgi:hypothetical protein